MDLLRDWLAPTIENELSKALQWKEAAPDNEQLHGEKPSYCDDDSNLRVQSTRSGVVQISKFLTFESPIQAILSDKTTRIGARIPSSATREYQEQYKQSFTKDTTGGLIQILEFEIVATHLGPRSDRLTLLVTRFKSLGSNGSGPFSVPRPIESPDKGCFALLDKLKGIRAQEKATSSQDHSTRESSAAASSIHSQVRFVVNRNCSNKNNSNSSNTAVDSQFNFATQVPLAMESPPLHRQNSAAQSPSKLSIKGSSEIFALQSQFAEAAESPSNGPAEFVGSKIANEVTADMISSVNAHNLVHAINKNYEARAIDVKKLVRNEPINKSVGEGADTTKLSQLQSEYKGRKLVERYQHHMDQAFSTLHSIGMENPVKGPLVNPEIATGSKNLQDLDIDSIPASLRPRDESSKKRKLDDRIISRDIRISKDQETLLSRPDSWLPADPSQREPRANVPIALLQSFNSKADMAASQGLESWSEAQKALPVDQIVTLSDDEASNAKALTSNTNSDIDSEEWPPSPNRDQLPPDSTPPTLGSGGLQNEVSEEQRSQILEPSLFSSQPKVGAQTPLQERDSLQRSNGNYEGSPATMKRRTPSSPSIVHPSPHLSVHISAQHQTLQLTARANEFYFPSEAGATHQSEDNLSGLEAADSKYSSAGSDIEMVIPQPLDLEEQSRLRPSPQESPPSTALQTRQPSTQVKRTPYPTGTGCDSSNSLMDKPQLIMDMTHETHEERFEQRNVHILSSTSTFVSKPDSILLSSFPEHNSKGSAPRKINSREISVEQGDVSARAAAAICTSRVEGGELRSMATEITYDLDNSEREEIDDPPESITETSESRNPQPPLHTPLSGKRPLRTDDTFVDGRQYSKRGKTKPSFFYPTRSSRRGKIPIPPALEIFGMTDSLPDPAISARQHRDDWFAARRSSGSSAARDGPFSPPKGYAMSMSSLADGSIQNCSDLATPIDTDDCKTVPEDAFTNGSSTPIIERADLYTADSPQRAAPELLNKKNAGSSPAPETVRIPPKYMLSVMGSPFAKDNQAQSINRAIKTPQDDKNCNARLLVKSPSASAALQTSSVGIQALQGKNLKVSSGNDTGVLSVPRRSYHPEKNEAHRSTYAFTSLASVEADQVECISRSQSTFKTFKSAYPEYDGNIKHFLALCKKIQKLWKGNSLHKSMWDDFLIRNKIDFARYVQKCMEKGDDPTPYDRFYEDEIDEPMYRKKVLTPQSLESFIHASDDGNDASTCNKSAATMPIPTTFSSTNTVVKSKASPTLERTGKATVSIDLTDNAQREISTSKEKASHQPYPPIQSSSSRQVPWKSISDAQMQPTSQDSQTLRHSAISLTNLENRTDSANRRAHSLLGLKTKLEIQSAKEQDEISADLKSKDRETGADETSRIRKKAKLKDPGADTGLEGQDQSSHLLWWQDENGPFKSFARSYLAIRPGNGNAFAKPKDIARGQRNYMSKVRKSRHLDVLGWSLDPRHRVDAS